MLQRGEKRIYDWLRCRSMGEVHDLSTAMEAGGWSESSIKTYLRKNKLAPFLLLLEDGRLKVLMNGR